jgi:hypothetical protein
MPRNCRSARCYWEDRRFPPGGSRLLCRGCGAAEKGEDEVATLLRHRRITRRPRSKGSPGGKGAVGANFGCLAPEVENLASTSIAGSASVEVSKHSHSGERDAGVTTRALHRRIQRVISSWKQKRPPVQPPHCSMHPDLKCWTGDNRVGLKNCPIRGFLPRIFGR